MSELTLRGSLRDRIMSKTPGSIPRSTCLLLDCSGSMSGRIMRLAELSGKFKGRVRRFAFSSHCVELAPKITHLEAEGGTDMAGAFLHIRDKGITHAVLITDGQPDDPKAALLRSEGLKLDIIYVGPDPAPKFLSDLVNHTGGKYGEASLHDLEIETTITALLPPPQSIKL